MNGKGVNDFVSQAGSVNWKSPPRCPRLQQGMVDIWLIGLDAAADSTCLSISEVARMERLVRPLTRQRYQRSRQAMRDILGRYLDLAPAHVPIAIQHGGKPVLAGHDGLQFNLSHTREVGLLAISPSVPVGVDVEWLRPLNNPRTMAERIFPDSLLKEMSATPGNLEERFLTLWTRFEACQKAFGLGVFATGTHSRQMCWQHFVPLPGSLACVALACAEGCISGMRFFNYIDRRRTSESSIS